MAGTELAIGVDIGGTKIATILSNRQGDVLAERVQPTQTAQSPDAIIDRVVVDMQEMIQAASLPVAGIGVGCPGTVDPVRGISLIAANMGDSWRDIPLRDEITRRLQSSIPVFVENDVNAGGVGELIFGAAQGMQNVVYVAIGTGLGGCAIVNGTLLHGATFTAMEIGHIGAIPAGRRGAFGLVGSPEQYVSGKGLLAGLAIHRHQYPDSPLATLESPSVADILAAAQQSDPLADRLLAEALDALTTVMAWCVTILNPEAIILGGGLGVAMRPLLDAHLPQMLSARVLPGTCESLQIRHAQVTSSALGAVAVAFHHLDRPTG